MSGIAGRISAALILDTYAHFTSTAQRQAPQAMSSILAGTLYL